MVATYLLISCIGDRDVQVEPPDTGAIVHAPGFASVEIPADWPDSGVPVDHDLDDDGALDTDDCNDADATVFPGATEVHCDEIDQDCDGADPRDCDDDGALATADGGDDCDDDNAYVYVGAPEMCDGADQDCDGDGWEAGVCAGEQQPGGMGVKLTGTPFGSPLIVRDVTGDGVADIRDGAYDHTGIVNGYGYWTGTEIPIDPGYFPTDNTQAAFYDLIGSVQHNHDFGDVDGDGNNDAGFIDTYFGDGILIDAGPIPTGGALVAATELEHQWVGDDPGYCWACYAATGDYNGDGLGDVAISVYDEHYDTEWDYPDGEGGLWVFWGGDFSGAHTQIGETWTDNLWEVGDITGDGIDDVIVDDPDGGQWGVGSAWLDGTDLANAPEVGTFAEDIAITFWNDTEDDGGDWFNVGDLDGDGDVELLSTYRGADGSKDAIEVVLYDSSLRGEITSVDAEGGWYVDGEWGEHSYSFAKRCAGGLLLKNDAVAHAFPIPTAIPPRGSPLPEPRLDFVPGEGRGFFPDCGDVTGDGLEDLVFGFRDYVNLGDNEIRIIPDWSIPWDDPTYW